MSKTLEFLQNQIASGVSRSELARRFGVPRSSLSLLLRGKLPGTGTKIKEQLNKALNKAVFCPHQKKYMAMQVCHNLSARACPTSSPAALKQWRACQVCVYRQKNKDGRNNRNP